jgi:hypothetical protein
MGGRRARDRRIVGLRNLWPKSRILAQVPRKGNRTLMRDQDGSWEELKQHRRRSRQVEEWFESALGGVGEGLGVAWVVAF